MIANTNPRLFRGYKLKEQLRLAFKLSSVKDAKAELDTFFWKATHSRIQIFKELAYKIRRHEDHILNTIETKLSNARVESINNKIKLFIRKVYGFRNIQNMLDMILLGCSNIYIPLPNRGWHRVETCLNRGSKRVLLTFFDHNYTRRAKI